MSSHRRTSVPAENGVGRRPHISTTTTTKKRPPLSNLTNHPRPSMVSCTATKSTKPKWSSATTQNAVLPQKTALPSTTSNIVVVSYKPKTQPQPQPQPQPPQPQRPSAASCDMDISPTPSNAHSVSISTCDSFNSPEVEYMDADALTITSNHPPLSDHFDTAGRFCKTEVLAATDIDNVVDVDDNYMDPQFCSTIACDIYNHLRASETQKRPLTDFMEQIQKDINASMRAILIDWLVEVAEEYRLVPDTLYLTVNYIDRYLSGNVMNRQRLQLLGVACMMIAAKYEEICAPQVEEFCYITDNTYFKDEVLHMESAVLNFLKFEMTAPTIKSFLRRFVRAAQVTNEISSIQLECFANYLAELSLLEYHMLQYAPSLIAASAVFLARYILSSSHKPWNSTLRHYTLYEPSDLEECVKALHQLCLNSHSCSLPAIREKYSQHKYKFVAKTYCPSSIPEEYFQNSSC